jgi:hypothetical protein
MRLWALPRRDFEPDALVGGAVAGVGVAAGALQVDGAAERLGVGPLAGDEDDAGITSPPTRRVDRAAAAVGPHLPAASSGCRMRDGAPSRRRRNATPEQAVWLWK